MLGILKEDNVIQLSPKKIQAASAESQQQLSPALCFTLGYLLQNKISPRTLLKHIPTKIKKRINYYIKNQLEFIALAKTYINSSTDKENKLIKFIQNKSIDFNFTFNNQTIFMCAAKKNDLVFLKTLRKLSSFEINFQNFHGETALMLAATHKDPAGFKALLDAKADINLVNNSNHTALTYAAQADAQENIRLLLNAKSEIDVTKASPLRYALKNNSPNSVIMLLDAKASINQKITCGETALMYAAKEGYTSIMKILLEKKAEIDMQDSILQKTALMQAIEGDKIENVKILIESKADIEIRDRSGNTAADFAERYPQMKKIRILNKPSYCEIFGIYARTALVYGTIPEIISPAQKNIQNKK